MVDKPGALPCFACSWTMYSVCMGVVTSLDPHGVANDMINGDMLCKIKDRYGIKMTDKRLVEMLSIANPDVGRLYKLSSSYVHLSEQHFYHFIEHSRKNKNGLRDFVIGCSDEYLDEAHNIELVATFKVVTKGVLEVVRQWIANRGNFGDTEALIKRFAMEI